MTKAKAKKKAKVNKQQAYKAHKKQAGQRQTDISRDGRDIGSPPEVVNAQRRDKCRRNLKLFCETYREQTFNLAWGKDHLTVLKRLQAVILAGGLLAIAMPRGSGKTSMIEAAIEWAVLYGHRRYPVIVASDADAAIEILNSIKTELECNPLYSEDFPKAVYPIQCLEGIANRCKGQTCDGERTRITWTGSKVIMPTVAGSDTSGTTVQVAGITGRIRGMKHKLSDGSISRPDLVLLDDPQTDESARSPSQCEKRERIISGAILGLSGPGQKISGLAAVTVIAEGDAVDNMLDRKKHPEWTGERFKLMNSMPENQKLWDEYREIRDDELRDGSDNAPQATAYYKKNRKQMDAGAKPAWAVRFNEDEISAVQFAMNIYLRDPAAFAAEYQNKPLVEDHQDYIATADQIVMRATKTPRRIVPLACTVVSAMIDVQDKCLWFAVVAWDEHFGGQIIDYGAYPDQNRNYFSGTDIKKTLRMTHRGADRDGAIYAGIHALAGQLLGSPFLREDGAEMRVKLCLVDANWGPTSDTVYSAVRNCQYAAQMLPSHGRGITAARMPMSQYTRKSGEQVGLNWRIPNVKGKRIIRHAIYDTNYWKMVVHQSLMVSVGDKGALTLFAGRPASHRMISEHLTAEPAVKTTGHGREIIEFQPPPPNRDNHLLDNVTGCAVAASMCGIATDAQKAQINKPKKRRPRHDRVKYI